MKNGNAPAHSLETPKGLETAREIADDLLKCTPQHVNALHRRGIIPAKVCIGRLIRFDRRDVLEALAAHSMKGGRP
jgi:hypothetical protein